jgi:hypothetical protein
MAGDWPPKQSPISAFGLLKRPLARSYQDENAPAANLEGDTPEAKAKTKSIREMAASMGLEPSEFYYGGSAPKESLMGVGGVTMAYASNGSTVANGKKFPEGVVVFDPPPEASDHIQRGTIAHEGFHRKFKTVMKGLAAESEKLTGSLLTPKEILSAAPRLRRSFRSGRSSVPI